MTSYNLFSSSLNSSFDSSNGATSFGASQGAQQALNDPWSTSSAGSGAGGRCDFSSPSGSSLSSMRDNSAFSTNQKLQFLAGYSDDVPPLSLPMSGRTSKNVSSYSDSLSQGTNIGGGVDHSIWSSSSEASTGRLSSSSSLSDASASFHHHPGVERINRMPPLSVNGPVGGGGSAMMPPPSQQQLYQQQQNKMAVKFNVAAPEFHPTAVPPQNKGSAEAHDISDNYNATPVPSQQMRHNALAAGQHRMRRASLGRMESGASVSGPSMSSPSGSHIAPPSGLSETNTTRGPITIQPAGGSSRATGRGTSSTQSSAASQSMSRQDYLVKTIYHKLITCQSGDCRRRHSCIECLECNSLFCENCSNINLHALTLMEQPGAMDEFGAGGGSGGPLDEDDPLMGWDFLGTRGDLRQIPGYCPSCDRQECFSINLAMMKLLMKNDEYRKFAALLRRAHAGGMSAARKQQSGSFQRQNYGGSGGNKGLNATGTTKQHAAMKRRGSSNSIGGYKSVDDM